MSPSPEQQALGLWGRTQGRALSAKPGLPMSPSGVKSTRPPGPGKRLWCSALLPATHCALWRALLLIQGQSLANWQQPEVAQVAPRGSWEGLGSGPAGYTPHWLSHCCKLHSAVSLSCPAHHHGGANPVPGPPTPDSLC